jgi:hypothetical protein
VVPLELRGGRDVAASFQMIKILCEKVSPGLRKADVILTFLDVYGRRHFLQIERDFLVQRNGHSYYVGMKDAR